MKQPFKKVDKLPLIIMLLAPSVRLMIPAANTLVLYLIIPLLFIWSIGRSNGMIKYKGIKYYFLFLAWLLFTVITSTDKSLSISAMKTLIAGVLTSFIMYYMAASKIENGIYLSLSYIFLLGTTLLYLWNTGELAYLDIKYERLSDSLVNANDLAYYLFYVSCAFSLLFFHFRVGRMWKMAVYIALVVLAIWLSMITASRQILVVVIPYILICLIFQFINTRRFSLSKIIPAVIVVVVLLIPAYFYVENLLSGSFLEERMSIGTSDDSRTKLLKEAIQVGENHPIVGVGPGCFVKFSKSGGFAHNSYAELFATSGIPAVLLYLMMIVPAMRINWKRYKTTNDSIFAFLFLTCFIWILYNILYVFYSSLWLISFYYLLMGISDNIYKNRYQLPNTSVF